MTDLEQRLRAAFSDDAQRARLVHPDEPAPPEPRPLGTDHSRARPMAWVAVAAAFAVLALVAALTMLDADQSVDTLGPPVTEPPGPAGPTDIEETEGQLEPGRYFIDPDGDPATSMRVTYEIPDDGGAWEKWIGASRISGGPNTMLSIAMVSNVVRHGCTDHEPLDPAVGPSIDDLATALTQLAPFEVTSPPREVMLFGYEGKHVALTVPDIDFSTCTGGVLDGWISPLLGANGGEAFFGYGPEAGLTEEYWILDVDGARLVIITNTSPDAPAEWIAQRQAIIDSIRIVPAIEA
jgi:hypothetical protein